MKVYLVYECFSRESYFPYWLIVGAYTDKDLAEDVESRIVNTMWIDRSRYAVVDWIELGPEVDKLVFCQIEDYEEEFPVVVNGEHSAYCSYSCIAEETEYFLSLEEAKKKSSFWLEALSHAIDPNDDDCVPFFSEDELVLSDDGNSMKNGVGTSSLEFIELSINKVSLKEVRENKDIVLDENEELQASGGCYTEYGELIRSVDVELPQEDLKDKEGNYEEPSVNNALDTSEIDDYFSQGYAWSDDQNQGYIPGKN